MNTLTKKKKAGGYRYYEVHRKIDAKSGHAKYYVANVKDALVYADRRKNHERSLDACKIKASFTEAVRTRKDGKIFKYLLGFHCRCHHEEKKVKTLIYQHFNQRC